MSTFTKITTGVLAGATLMVAAAPAEAQFRYRHRGGDRPGHEVAPRGVVREPDREQHPDRILRDAVRRMLPKNTSLASKMLTKLKLFAGPEHDHQAQQPQPKDLGSK